MRTGHASEIAREEGFPGTLWLSRVGQTGDFLQEGQTFRGEIIFATEEAAHVRLENGTILRARLSDGVTLSEGETVWLSVRANDGESLILQLTAGFPGGAAPGETAAGLPAKAGPQPAQLHLSLAAALYDSGFPVEAETMKRAAAILEKFPDAGTNAAVFLAANRLEADSESIALIRFLQRPDFRVSEILARAFRQLAAEAVPFTNEGKLVKSAQTDMVDITNSSLSVSSGGQITETGGGGQPTGPEPSAGTGIFELPDPASAAGFAQLLQAAIGAADRKNRLEALQAAERSFFAAVEKPQDAEALQKAGEQLFARLEVLKTATASADGRGKTAAPDADRLLGGLKLLQAVDQYSYIQIPVFLGGRPSTVALTVFRQRRGVKKKPGCTTLLIVLETKNLGHMEALVSCGREDISIRFILSDPDTIDFLKERTAVLYRLVSESGHRLSGVSFQSAREPVTPTTVLSIVRENESSGKINILI